MGVLARAALLLLAARACSGWSLGWPLSGTGLSPPTAGGFADSTKRLAPSGLGTVVAVADFDRDRFLDVAALSPDLGSVSVSRWAHEEERFEPAGGLSAGTGGCPLRRIAGVAHADFDGDGVVDLLVQDGEAGCVFFGVGDATFNESGVVVLPELPADFVVVDPQGELVVQLFVAFENGTRAFYGFARGDAGVEVTVTVWEGSVKEDCALRKSSARPAPPAFVDLDGDCLPDLVVPTACGVEVWSSGAADRVPFWEMREGDAKRYRMLGLDVYNAAHGDASLLFADLNMDGTIDIAVANRNRGDLLVFLNLQKTRPHGFLCTRDPDWSLSRRVGIASGLDLRPASMGPLFGKIDVPMKMHVGDYDLDGLPDLLVTKKGSPVLYRNVGKWSAEDVSIEAHFVETDQEKTLARETGRGTAVSAFFWDTDEAGRQDVMVVMSGNTTALMSNSFISTSDSLFFKGTGLSSLPFRAEPRPFAPVPGNTFKVSYMARNLRHRVVRTCSQCPQSGTWNLQACNCLFGLLEISNYIEEMCVGAGANSRCWTNLMPNSMAVVWAEKGTGTTAWRMDYFTQRRGGQMLRVVAVLALLLVVLSAAIVYLQHRERKEDREDISEQHVQLFNFGTS